MKPGISVQLDAPSINVYGKFGVVARKWDEAGATWDDVGRTWDEDTGLGAPTPGLSVSKTTIDLSVGLTRADISSVPEKIVIIVTA